MQANQNSVERTYERLTLFIGFLVVAALGFGAAEYGPGLVSNVHDFYHPPKHTCPQPSEIMMRHVKTTPFEPSPEIFEFFDSQSAEYASNKRLGENYRMPPPRRP